MRRSWYVFRTPKSACNSTWDSTTFLTPAATLAEYPTILDLAPPKLWGYSRETWIAEKFEAMVKLGNFNSRLKDFFDIWLLARQFNFDGAILAEAIAKTFAHRGTALTASPLAFTSEFVSDPAKVDQWRGFLRKSRIKSAPDDLRQVVDALAAFLLPVARGSMMPNGLTPDGMPPGRGYYPATDPGSDRLPH